MRSSSHWSGWSKNAAIPPEMRLRVVSLPATVRRRKNSSSSSAESCSPSISTSVSTLIRSSWGSARLRREQLGRVGVQLHGRLLGDLPGRLVLGVLAPDHPVGPVEHPVAVLVGNAEELGDDDEGELGRDLGDEVGRALLDDRVDDVVGRGVDPVVELVDHARGEALVDQTAVPGVERRVHVEHEQLLLGEVVLGQVPEVGGLAWPTRSARSRG